MDVRRWWGALASLVGAILLVGGGGLLVARAGVSAPRPVYANLPHEAADPGVAVVPGGGVRAYLTGGRVLAADRPGGPWKPMGQALEGKGGPWALDDGVAWAPDAVQRADGRWLYYYSVKARGMAANQRCIGVAIADQPRGPFRPVGDKPLICPRGGQDDVPGRPDPASGVIDPSPVVTQRGRYLLYKTQTAPGTIRLVELSPDGERTTGRSRELIRRADSVENPTIVQRGKHFILFASNNWYDQCRYSTVWRSSTDIWSFANKPERTLLDQGNTGICGPGGADFIAGAGRQDHLLLHGWVCDRLQPCRMKGVVPKGAHRVLYAARLSWGADGHTPTFKGFVEPGKPEPTTAPKTKIPTTKAPTTKVPTTEVPTTKVPTTKPGTPRATTPTPTREPAPSDYSDPKDEERPGAEPKPEPEGGGLADTGGPGVLMALLGTGCLAAGGVLLRRR